MITTPRQRSAGRRWIGRLIGLTVLWAIACLAFIGGKYYRTIRSMRQLPPRGPQLDIHVLNVGNGSSELLITPGGHCVLIDTGPRDTPAVEAAALLGRKGAVDLVILTSTRAEAIGGFRAVLDAVNVRGPVLLPGDSISFRKAGRAARDVLAALHEHGLQAIPYDQYLLNHPNAVPGEGMLQIAGLPVFSAMGHSLAMAVRVEYGASSLLYAAGIEADGQRDLLSRNSNLACDVLAIPPGATTNTASPEMMASAGPEVIAIGCDALHVPGAETQRWLQASGARTGRTDLLGSYTLHLDPLPNQPVEWSYTPTPVDANSMPVPPH